MPVDLAGVYLASCASGKGLRGYPGLSMVFYHHEVPARTERLARYLDLGLYAAQQGINESEALETGLKQKATEFTKSGSEIYAKA